MNTYADTYSLVNANLVCGKQLLKNATMVVKDGRIDSISTSCIATCGEIIDCTGLLVGPGLIDMHIHGCGGFDTSLPDLTKNLFGMADFLQSHGITSFQLAIVMDMDLLKEIKETLDKYPNLGEHIIGVYPEGPFIAPEKKGGIPQESVNAPDQAYLEKILAVTHAGRPLVTSMTFAPEVPRNDALMEYARNAGVNVAWGHSAAYFDQLVQQPKMHITHLYNAMVGLEHRRPGLALLPFLSPATYELIGDYVHVDREMVHFTITKLGTERMCLISDGMSFCGLGAGEGVYLGKKIYSDGRACYYTDNGTLIGSGLLINDTARNLCKDGFIDIVQMFEIASTNPARVLGLQDRGMLECGRIADLVMLDDDLRVVRTFKHSAAEV